MNTARLARRFAEAKNDPIAMAEAIGDEIASDYVTRDLLAEQMALLRGEMQSLRGDVRIEVQALRTEMASMKADLQRTLILTQIAGFVAVLVAVLLKS